MKGVLTIRPVVSTICCTLASTDSFEKLSILINEISFSDGSQASILFKVFPADSSAQQSLGTIYWAILSLKTSGRGQVLG